MSRERTRRLVSAAACVLAPVAAVLAPAGCMYETGEPWSTKHESSPGATLSSTPLDPDPDADAERVSLAGHASQPEVAGMSEPVGPAARAPVQEAGRDTAIRILLEAAEAPDLAGALLRANAIQGMQHAPDHLDPLVRQGLVDPNRGVRFVAAMTIGERRMEHLAHLLEPMLQDPAPSVEAAAMFALRRCGRPVDLSPLAAMIVSDDPEVRGNAAMVLGLLGNPSAVPMIRRAVGRGMELVQSPRVKMVDLQLAEALVMLGQEREIEAIRAALFAPAEEGEITALACMICGRLNDGRAAPNLVRLALEDGRVRRPAEVRMAATWALARIDGAEADVNVPLAYVNSPYYQLRVQAALTLGEIGDASVSQALATMLGDENPLVQVAAATAILQIENSTAESRDRL